MSSIYKYITINDSEYPDKLKEVIDPPQKLFYIGDISLLKHECISIVGTRRASPYGKWVGYEISKKLSNYGFTIVSGMAEGIDTQAHLGALDNDAKTIAVLGTPIDVCFPKSNEKIYKQIAEKGLIVSEYDSGAVTGSWSFPQRNRIISGLSSKVIVVEGTMKSGSMITAKLAVEQSRDLYAVPGNINNPNSIGTNNLISDGAVPIISLDELANTLGISPEEFHYEDMQLSINEMKVIECIKLFPGCNVDELSYKLKMRVVDIINIISILEIKELVTKEGNNIFLV